MGIDTAYDITVTPAPEFVEAPEALRYEAVNGVVIDRDRTSLRSFASPAAQDTVLPLLRAARSSLHPANHTDREAAVGARLSKSLLEALAAECSASAPSSARSRNSDGGIKSKEKADTAKRRKSSMVQGRKSLARKSVARFSDISEWWDGRSTIQSQAEPRSSVLGELRSLVVGRRKTFGVREINRQRLSTLAADYKKADKPFIEFRYGGLVADFLWRYQCGIGAEHQAFKAIQSQPTRASLFDKDLDEDRDVDYQDSDSDGDDDENLTLSAETLLNACRVASRDMLTVVLSQEIAHCFKNSTKRGSGSSNTELDGKRLAPQSPTPTLIKQGSWAPGRKEPVASAKANPKPPSRSKVPSRGASRGRASGRAQRSEPTRILSAFERLQTKALQVYQLKRRNHRLSVEVEFQVLERGVLLSDLDHLEKPTQQRQDDGPEREDLHRTFWRLYHQEDRKINPTTGPVRDTLGASGRWPITGGATCTSLSTTLSRTGAALQRQQCRLALADTASNFWRPACDVSLPDAKWSHTAVAFVGAHKLPTSPRSPPSPAASRAALGEERSPQRDKSTVRKVVQHRKAVHRQRATQRSQAASPPAHGVAVASRPHQIPGATGIVQQLQGEAGDASSSEGEETPRGGSFRYFDLGCFLEPRKRQNMRRQQAASAVLGRGSGRVAEHLPTLARPAAALQVSSSAPTLHGTSPDWSLPAKAPSAGPGFLPPVVSLNTEPFMRPWQEAAVLSASEKRKVDPGSGITTQRWRVPALENDEPPAFADTAPESAAAALRYIRACQMAGVMPNPNVLRMAHTRRMSMGDQQLLDDDLTAMATIVRQLDRLEEVDLGGSSLLSDCVIVLFLQKLFGDPASTSLERLVLRSCRGAQRSTVKTVVDLLARPDGISCLRHLDLSGIQLPPGSQQSLCAAVRGHPALCAVHLADVGLGLHPSAQLCVTSLLEAPALNELDLGWNCFGAEVFQAMGQGVCQSKIQRLSLAGCSKISGAANEDEEPICNFLECLSYDRTLCVLDLSWTRLDHGGALVLEDALSAHVNLVELRIGNNPLGVSGMRSFLRLLTRSSSGLKRFACNNCDGHEARGTCQTELTFNASDPSGRYRIDLRFAQHRALLRMLYCTAARLQIPFDEAFLELQYDPSSVIKKGAAISALNKQQKRNDKEKLYRHPKKADSAGVFPVPFQVGTLSFCFCIRRALSKLSGDGLELSSISEAPATCFLKKCFELMRFRPSDRKVVPLLAQYRALAGQPKEQLLMLDALSHDFILQQTYLPVLLKGDTRATQPYEVVSRLIASIEGGTVERFATLTLIPNLNQYMHLYKHCRQFLLLNVENPTGHYHLNLGNLSDHAVAEVILLLDRWGSELTRHHGLPDTSMHGQWSNIRNCTYQSLNIDVVTEWLLPEFDYIDFDFVTWARPPRDALSTPKITWERMMTEIVQSDCTPADKVAALCSVSHLIYPDSLQVREILGCFHSARLRDQVLVKLFLRLCDPQNMKLIRCAIGDADEWAKVTKQLGTVTVFPFFQPEGLYFDGDLSIYEERLAAHLAIRLASRERIENLRNENNVRKPVHIYPDGRQSDKLYAGVPPAWAENMDSLPTEGRLRFTYTCAPEDRALIERETIASSFGRWNLNPEPSVLWWSGITDEPEFILTFLCFILSKFDNIYDAFRAIDGPGGNGEISLQEMQTGMQKLGWTACSKNPQLLKDIFRYLDPDRGGQISLQEWEVLGQLWKELQLCILEFLQHVHRLYVDIDDAFDAMDVDGSDVIELDEWEDAVQHIGFFGPSLPIFYVIAATGRQGAEITREQWDDLDGFWESREELYRRIKDPAKHRGSMRDFEAKIPTGMQHLASESPRLPVAISGDASGDGAAKGVQIESPSKRTTTRPLRRMKTQRVDDDQKAPARRQTGQKLGSTSSRPKPSPVRREKTGARLRKPESIMHHPS